MHDSTKDLVAYAKKACLGPLCPDSVRDETEALLARVRTAQAALRATQDRCRAMVADEPDRALRARLEPYAQASRGMDRELEGFAAAAIRVLDVLKEFEQMEAATRAEIDAGLDAGKTPLDLGSYHLDTKRLADPKKRGTVVDEVVDEVRLRVEVWAAKQSHP